MVNAYPAGIHLGASWNRDLVKTIGSFMGSEFRQKGVHVALGPVVGPLGRVVKGGRNWEGYSPDPYLAGALASEAVKGLQKYVIASVKHFIANEQETNRRPGLVASISPAVSSNIDDRTMHELYLWPFQDIVRVGVGSVMCSYQRLNNTYGCENSKALNGLLKGELGFQGFVVTDWTAVSGSNSSMAGTDMIMPVAKGTVLTTAARASALGQSRLDDMATRILAAWFKLGMDSPEYPAKGVGMPIDILKPHKLVDARDPKSKAARLQAAIEGHVLVKNVNNALPLVKPKLLSLFGYDGTVTAVNNHDPIAKLPVSRWLLGLEALDVPDLQLGFNMVAGLGAMPNSARRGHVYNGGGSGAGTPAYITAPFNEIQQRAIDDDTFLLWDFQSENPNVHPESSACLIFINEFASEGSDRPSLADPGSDRLVQNVAKKCSNTMVVIHNAGIRLVDAWIEHPNVTAVIFAHLPGSDSGKALVEILYGNKSPSGRLPYTLARKESDYGDLLNPSMATTRQSDFVEGVYIDFKHFVKHSIKPRYEFGFGLTYTSFNYSELVVKKLSDSSPNLDTDEYAPSRPVGEGGNPALWSPLVTVEVRVENTGKVDGAEVIQLYLGLPGNDVPQMQLRGFQKQTIRKGAAETVLFQLNRRDLSAYNVTRQEWQLRRGEYKVFVGKSVSDIQLQSMISFAEEEG